MKSIIVSLNDNNCIIYSLATYTKVHNCKQCFLVDRKHQQRQRQRQNIARFPIVLCHLIYVTSGQFQLDSFLLFSMNILSDTILFICF